MMGGPGAPSSGWRGYPGGGDRKKKKKKPKKGFGTL
jgi:hypothetical protein